LTSARLASGFWVSAKLRQIQNAGGYASILVKGHEEAGSVTLVLRNRNGELKLAIPAMPFADANGERRFEWRKEPIDDPSLLALIERELRFDRDQWFVECECTENQFAEIFNIT
jgi:hypothetical protein